MTQAIQAALSRLDKEDDNHWTADGSPRVDVVQKITSDDTITRAMITNADPKFSRTSSQPAPIADAPTLEADDTAPADAPTLEEEAAVIAAEEADKPDDAYILEIPLGEVFASEQKLLVFQVEANAQCVIWQKELEQLKARLVNMGNLSAKADAVLSRIKRGRKNSDTEVIRAYQARQKEVRLLRAERAQAFIDQGIDQGMLARQITGKSQLDQALSQRKAAPGSTRPDPRMPVRGMRGH